VCEAGISFKGGQTHGANVDGGEHVLDEG